MMIPPSALEVPLLQILVSPVFVAKTRCLVEADVLWPPALSTCGKVVGLVERERESGTTVLRLSQAAAVSVTVTTLPWRRQSTLHICLCDSPRSHAPPCGVGSLGFDHASSPTCFGCTPSTHALSVAFGAEQRTASQHLCGCPLVVEVSH